MSDIDTSLSLKSQTKIGNREEAPLLSFNGVSKVPGPNNTVILHHGQSGRRILVRPDVASALGLCSQFKPLLDHAKLIIQALPELKGHTQSALDTLMSVDQAGFFESTESAWGRLTKKAADDAKPAPSRVFILTCDRPFLLKRLLISLSSINLDHQNIEGIWIIDDSRDSTCINQGAKHIEELSVKFKIPLIHFDHNHRQACLKILSKHLATQLDSISFLLDRKPWDSLPTYGLARNWALLLSAGRRALIWDDDTIAEAVSPPFEHLPLKFGNANDREAVFFNSEEEMNQHTHLERGNPVTLMLSHLGEYLSTILNEVTQSHTILAGSDGEMIRRFGAGSRILLAQCGSWGDPGTHSTQWLLHQPMESIRRLLQSQGDIEDLLRSRSHWFGYRGTTLTSYGTLSQLTGLDHTDLLPPYLPAGRGEDILFGVMLQQVHPHSPVLSEGWSVRHHPLENRDTRGKLTGASVRPGLTLLTDWLGQEMPEYSSATPIDNLRSIAERISKLTTMQTNDLEALVSRQLISKQSALMQRCSDHLINLVEAKNVSNVEKWKSFLEENRNLVMAEFQAPQKNPLDHYLSLANHDLNWVRQQGKRLCKALTDWPDICEIARQHLI